MRFRAVIVNEKPPNCGGFKAVVLDSATIMSITDMLEKSRGTCADKVGR